MNTPLVGAEVIEELSLVFMNSDQGYGWFQPVLQNRDVSQDNVTVSPSISYQSSTYNFAWVPYC